MKRTTLLCLSAIAAGAVTAGLVILIRMWTEPKDRVAVAQRRQGATVRQLFLGHDLSYPPYAIYLRAFKSERELELWARPPDDARYRLVHIFHVLGSSGRLGPKRREGDRQVPEGLYFIDRFNPESRFHLSLGLDYPNASDRVRSDPVNPGSDIFIHGGRATIGCLPIGDDAVEVLYLIALHAENRVIPVHVFPSRRENGSWKPEVEHLASTTPALRSFWNELAPALDRFNIRHELPSFRVGPDGQYLVTE